MYWSIEVSLRGLSLSSAYFTVSYISSTSSSDFESSSSIFLDIILSKAISFDSSKCCLGLVRDSKLPVSCYLEVRRLNSKSLKLCVPSNCFCMFLLIVLFIVWVSWLLLIAEFFFANEIGAFPALTLDSCLLMCC